MNNSLFFGPTYYLAHYYAPNYLQYTAFTRMQDKVFSLNLVLKYVRLS